MEPNKRRVNFQGARVPVALVALFVLGFLLIDSIHQRWWDNAAVWTALLVVVLAWLVVPEIRKRR